MNEMPANNSACYFMPGDNGNMVPAPALLTEAELSRLLRIPELNRPAECSAIIGNLRRAQGLPCVHISRQPLFPLNAVLKWLDAKAQKESVSKAPKKSD
jgi:hypothetical protein